MSEPTSDNSNIARPEPERMHCMEVWGGNTAVNKWFEMPGLTARVYSRPHAESAAGGDVYYLSSCASGRITRVLLADVSGHGEQVSQVAVNLRELMRDHVSMVRQTKFVQAVNRKFIDNQPAGEFATAVIGTFFSPNRSYEFCNAGHPPPLLYRADTESWSILARDEAEQAELPPNYPLGIYADTQYQQQSLTLQPGDAVLTYTDAVTESHRPDGSLLTTEGLLEIARSIEMKQSQDFIQQLVRAVQALNPDNLTGDDTTIILCQATRTKPSLKDDLLAPIRFLRRPVDNTIVAGTTVTKRNRIQSADSRS